MFLQHFTLLIFCFELRRKPLSLLHVCHGAKPTTPANGHCYCDLRQPQLPWAVAFTAPMHAKGCAMPPTHGRSPHAPRPMGVWTAAGGHVPTGRGPLRQEPLRSPYRGQTQRQQGLETVPKGPHRIPWGLASQQNHTIKGKYICNAPHAKA